MTKRIWTGTCAAFIGIATAAAMSAQTTIISSPQTTTSSSDRKITVTGCLREASANATEPSAATTTAGTTGTTAGIPPATGTTGDAASVQKFVLTEASPSTGDTTPPSATGTTGTTTPPPTETTTSPSSPSAAQTYRLIANPAALSPHIGKELELTGTLVDNPDSPSASTTTASDTKAQALRVESGKVVAASCSPQ